MSFDRGPAGSPEPSGPDLARTANRTRGPRARPTRATGTAYSRHRRRRGGPGIRPSKHRQWSTTATGARMTHVTQDRPEAARPEQASVRPAGPADAFAVGSVQAASWRQAYAGRLAPEVLAGFEPNALAAVWRQSLEQPPTPRHRLLVACRGRDVVGLAADRPLSRTRTRTSGSASCSYWASIRRLAEPGTAPACCRPPQTPREGRGPPSWRAWVSRDDASTREFLQRAGLEPDSAWRDRGIDDAGHRLREVRLVASLTDLAPATSDELARNPTGEGLRMPTDFTLDGHAGTIAARRWDSTEPRYLVPARPRLRRAHRPLRACRPAPGG